MVKNYGNHTLSKTPQAHIEYFGITALKENKLLLRR